MPTPNNYKYVGLASQLLATLSVAFFIGYQVDKYLGLKIPITLLTLPLLVLFVSLWKIVKDTSKKPKDD